MRRETQEVMSWVNSACMDMGMDHSRESQHGMISPSEMQEAERYAEDVLNNPELLADMIGDHIHNNPAKDDILCDLLDLEYNEAFQRAAEIIIERM